MPKTKKAKTSPKTKTPAETTKLSLYPGRFYVAINGAIWCCVSIELFREEHAQAICVRVSSPERSEYFYLDGRYDEAGKREHTFVREVVASRAVFE